jgi:hypothetical protein
MRTPELELLWWEGCPSTGKALDELREALADLGLEHVPVSMREIRTDARDASFAGSPTILIDGLDFAAPPAGDGAAGEGEPVGLTCRIYHRRDGRISPTPDPQDLRDALGAAAQRDGVSR